MEIKRHFNPYKSYFRNHLILPIILCMTLSCGLYHNCFVNCNLEAGDFRIHFSWYENKSKMEFNGDINATALSKLVDQTPSVKTVEAEHLSSIHQNVGQHLCRWINLGTLDIQNSFLKALPSRFLFDCQNLGNLNLRNNMITEIAHDAFENLTGVMMLQLSSNFIRALHKDTFKPLINCILIDLQHNQLQSIDADLFYHNEMLNTIFLDYNDLRTISRSFSMLKELRRLRIGHNPHLENIDLSSNIEQRLGVDVSYCNLKNISIPPNVAAIDAMNNQISSINIHPQNNLNYLDVSHNNLTDIANISNFQSLRSLFHLNTAFNANNIDLTTLYSLKNISQLKIDFNSNQNVSIDEMKQKWSHFQILYLYSHGMSFQQYMQIKQNCERYDITFRLYCVDAWEQVLQCLYNFRPCRCILP